MAKKKVPKMEIVIGGNAYEFTEKMKDAWACEREYKDRNGTVSVQIGSLWKKKGKWHVLVQPDLMSRPIGGVSKTGNLKPRDRFWPLYSVAEVGIVVRASGNKKLTHNGNEWILTDYGGGYWAYGPFIELVELGNGSHQLNVSAFVTGGPYTGTCTPGPDGDYGSGWTVGPA